MNPLVAVLMFISIVLIFVLPRKYVIAPILIVTFLTPMGAQYYVLGVHLFVSRILILAGFLRIIWAKLTESTEVFSGVYNSIDKLFIACALSFAVCTSLEFGQFQAVLNQCGFLLDAVGSYLVFRFLVRDQDDIARVMKTFAFIVAVLAVTMTIERTFVVNVFGYLGGSMRPPIREGAIRASATFEGPIRCGTFGATLLLLFAWLWQSGKARLLAIVGLVGSTVMVITSASSTPLLAFLACGLAILMWPLRNKMRIVRWGLVILLIALHLVMKAPVWFLIDHVDLIAGNSGYHRALLIDMCVKHFSEWWLIGAKSTASWAYEMSDQANQFVGEAENGGLLTLILFILMISRSFGRLAKARKLVEGNTKAEWFYWLLGGTLFAYVVSFFGISFASQEQFSWYLFFALVCAATTNVSEEKVRVESSVPGFARAKTPFLTPAGSMIQFSQLLPRRGSFGTTNDERQ